MIGEIHVGDVGTTFIVTIKDENDEVVNISASTTRDLIFQKPDGELLTVAGTFVTDGTDGQLKYITVSGDLNQQGKWQLQAHVVLTAGSWKSDIYKFTVYKNLGC
jgi:hypothetical protein